MSEDDTKTKSKTISAHTVLTSPAKSPDSRDSGDFASCTTAVLQQSHLLEAGASYRLPEEHSLPKTRHM